jgi:hypothetical protein
MAVNVAKLKSMRPHGVKSLEEADTQPVPGQDTHIPR